MALLSSRTVLACGAVILVLTGCANREVRLAGSGAPAPAAVQRQIADGPATAETASEARVLTEALRRMALQAEREGQFEAAAGHHARLAERLADPAPAVADQARMLRYAGRPQQAMLVASRALETAPEGSALPLALELAKAQIAGGLVPDAVTALEALRQAHPNAPEVRKVLGIAYDRSGRAEAAQDSYRAALALAPGDAETVNNLALSLAMSGRLEEGTALLEDLAAAPDAPVQARQNLALLYVMGGDLPRAEALVRRILPADLADEVIRDLRAMAPEG